MHAEDWTQLHGYSINTLPTEKSTQLFFFLSAFLIVAKVTKIETNNWFLWQWLIDGSVLFIIHWVGRE